MMSLFSTFDLMIFSREILVYMFFFSLIFFYCNFSSSWINFKNYVMKSLLSFFYSLNKNFFSDFMMVMILCVMSIFFLTNIFSVLSFNFPLTSQPSFVMFFSFSLWLSLFLMQTLKNMKGFVSHCVPEGSPEYLVVFLFLIEIVSNSIRPLTLGVRLCANILAGHLLMILLSKLVLSYFILSPLYVILNMVELFVALIQSYIFVTLFSLYYSEVK